VSPVREREKNISLARVDKAQEPIAKKDNDDR
jgi:hypothetical protein